MPGQRILIIQDNPRERMELTEYLESLGFKIDIASDGPDAEAILDDHPVRMVLADLGTPNFDGIAMLKSVKNKMPETQILFIADHPMVEDAIEIMKEGAFDFIIKPLEHEQLKLSTRRIFKDNRSHSGEIKKPSISHEQTKIVTQDKEMLRLLNLARRVADSSASVLIQGESGTGKELFARFIHENSRRKEMPFVAVNCAALPESLLESELFGHEKGAFTGAISRKLGKFELAHTGTIFLDEITEMQYHLQSKLLRVLQEKKIDRVGGTEPVDVDVRVLATTNRDIKEAIKSNEFREDLYYRLSTIPIVIPPLRNRFSDLELLCNFFIKKYSFIDARDVKGLTISALNTLKNLKFQGNVRELENMIHRAVLLAEGPDIKPDDFLLEEYSQAVEPDETNPGFPYSIEPAPLKEIEEKVIFHTLDKTDGNRTHAAKILGISVRTLRNKLNEYKKS